MIATRPPSATIRAATARPMPRLAPVIRAVLPAKRRAECRGRHNRSSRIAARPAQRAARTSSTTRCGCRLEITQYGVGSSGSSSHSCTPGPIHGRIETNAAGSPSRPTTRRSVRASRATAPLTYVAAAGARRGCAARRRGSRALLRPSHQTIDDRQRQQRAERDPVGQRRAGDVELGGEQRRRRRARPGTTTTACAASRGSTRTGRPRGCRLPAAHSVEGSLAAVTTAAAARRPDPAARARAALDPSCRCRPTRCPATPAPTSSPPRTSRSRPGERAVLPTGIAIALPDGYAAFVHPRSGLAARAGLGLVNAPGTIDSGYRGEIKVIVINHDPAARAAAAPRRADRAAGVPAGRAAPIRRGRRAARVRTRRRRARLDRGRGASDAGTPHRPDVDEDTVVAAEAARRQKRTERSPSWTRRRRGRPGSARSPTPTTGPVRRARRAGRRGAARRPRRAADPGRRPACDAAAGGQRGPAGRRRRRSPTATGTMQLGRVRRARATRASGTRCAPRSPSR